MCITMRKKRVNKKRKRSDFDLITEIDLSLTLKERNKNSKTYFSHKRRGRCPRNKILIFEFRGFRVNF